MPSYGFMSWHVCALKKNYTIPSYSFDEVLTHPKNVTRYNKHKMYSSGQIKIPAAEW